jgi:CRP-like cAMP-binding protein
MTLDVAYKLLDRRVWIPGEIILKEGEEGNRAYIIQEGKVEVFRTVNGKKITLGTRETGDVLGEMALIGHVARNASAIAVTKTVCVVISRMDFEQTVKRATPLMRGLLRILVTNVRSLDEVAIGVAPRPGGES